MKNHLKELSKKELVKLKEDIDNRIKFLEIKAIEPQVETILSLKRGDKIFGIRLSFGGHRLVEPKELKGKVDIIDYCDITSMSVGLDDHFRIGISHPVFPFGINTTLYKEDYENEHCYLCIDTMKTGYDGFYTLKPENWKEDLKIAYQKHLKHVEKYHQERLKIYEDKLNLFLVAEEKISHCI